MLLGSCLASPSPAPAALYLPAAALLASGRDSCLSARMLPCRIIIGVDEAGRGPWAGPVTAAAVILDPDRPIAGLRDSKKLSGIQRERLAPMIMEQALAWSVSHASVREIDEMNIRQATFLAMQRAIGSVHGRILAMRPDTDPSAMLILVDGNALPDALPAPAQACIGGDASEPAISAASILAKTARDRIMTGLCQQYPGYEFSAHKGYGTEAHALALARLGPCEAHRRSFAPVRESLRTGPARPERGTGGEEEECSC